MWTEVEIVPYRDGPYLVRGPFSLKDQNGVEIDASRRTIALCRCGKSRVRPFCDGTHRLIRFQAPSSAEDYQVPSSGKGARGPGAPLGSRGARDVGVAARLAAPLGSGQDVPVGQDVPARSNEQDIPAGSNEQDMPARSVDPRASDGADRLRACRLLVQDAIEALGTIPENQAKAMRPLVSQLRAAADQLLPEGADR